MSALSVARRSCWAAAQIPSDDCMCSSNPIFWVLFTYLHHRLVTLLPTALYAPNIFEPASLVAETPFIGCRSTVVSPKSIPLKIKVLHSSEGSHGSKKTGGQLC